MKLKVCGMKNPTNIQEILELGPDYMGFIFYEQSPRNVGGDLNEALLANFPKTTKKIGVFVNEEVGVILNRVQEYDLDLVQLHGDETPDIVAELYALGIRVIKAFSIDENFDFKTLSNYHPFVEHFLFDTKGKLRGGTGKKFDWTILSQYDQQLSFFLSGGIESEDLTEITRMSNLNIHAIDVNSKFEIEPGLKNVEKLKGLNARMQR